MEMQNVEQGRVIGNVGLLDLRKATEASIAGISRIDNVGAVLYSPETARLVARLNIGNAGASVEVPEDAKMLTGQVTFSRDYFRNQEAALNLVVMGPVVVEPDLPIEDIEKGLQGVTMMGPLLCPHHLLGIMQSKTRRHLGPVIAYTSASRIVMGRLNLDESYLLALEDASALVVMGRLSLPEVLPNDLLEQKIERVQVMGRIMCHEENAQAILTRVVDQTPKITTIPAGFEFVDRPLMLDNILLESLPGRNLYCTDRIQIDSGVDASLLDEHVEALISEDIIICPVELRRVISQKCNMLEARVIFYEGELWMVDGETDLRASRFDYLEGKATLVVYGELTMDAEADPRMLAERLAKVHNLGQIRCTPQQMGAIQARLGLSDGDLVDAAQAESTGDGTGNVGYLAL
jgi:hypothetical protein